MSGSTAYLTKSEAAATCGCSPSTVQRWCRLGLEHRYNAETHELEVAVGDLVRTGRLAADAVPQPAATPAGPSDPDDLAVLRVERAAFAARVEELQSHVTALTSQLRFMEALARKAGLI